MMLIPTDRLVIPFHSYHHIDLLGQQESCTKLQTEYIL